MKTSGQMRNHLLEKAAEDKEFRTRLVNDPKNTIRREFDVEIPDGYAINIMEDTSDTMNIVLPPSAQLSTEELQAVSGASWHSNKGQNDSDSENNAPQWWDPPSD